MAGFADPAEGQLDAAAGAVIVHEDLAAADLARQPQLARAVAGPDAGDQPVFGTVGDADRLGLVLEGDQHLHGAEDLLLGQRMAGIDLGKQRRQHEMPARRGIGMQPALGRQGQLGLAAVDEAYEAEGGRVTTDLFADQSYFEDVALLHELFTAKLEAHAGTIIADGWKWAEPIRDSYVGYYEIEQRKLDRIYAQEGELSEAEAERYDELAELANGDVLDAEGEAELAALQAILDGGFTDEQRAMSGVLFYVDQSGALKTLEGLVTREDRAAAIEAGFLRPSVQIESGSDTPKSPISNALRDDLGRVAMGARQHAILRDPDLLLDLLAYQLSHGLQWRKPFGLAAEAVPNWPTTEAEGYDLDERLAGKEPREMYGKDLAKSFRAFRQKGQDHTRGELIRCLAALFRGGDEQLSALIDKATAPQIREVWTPTAANFFSRVGGPYLNELWRDLLDLPEDHPTATTFAKLKKAEKAAKLEALFGDDATRRAHGVTEAQAARIDAWLPEGME